MFALWKKSTVLQLNTTKGNSSFKPTILGVFLKKKKENENENNEKKVKHETVIFNSAHKQFKFWCICADCVANPNLGICAYQQLHK